jgi:3-hydroxybutyryl-CoA dehydrogenase
VGDTTGVKAYSLCDGVGGMHVAVLGAGQRGQDVARRSVRAGHTVALWDADANAVMDCIDELGHGLDDPAVSDRLDGTTGIASAVDGADLVVDATDGAVARRRELLAEVETAADDDALMATGDTETSVTAVAAGLRAPGRAVGLHAVDSTGGNIVEVVVADQTTTDTRTRATAFVDSLDATPIVVRDSPGFAAARLELAAIAEAIRTVEDGVASVPAVDRAATGTADGGKRGPLARADAMGLDRVLSGLDDLVARLDDRFEPPALLREKVGDGELGAPTGEGFYVWENGEPTETAVAASDVSTQTDEVERR